MLKRITNYLKNNRIDCHADKSARNGRVSHYGVFALCRTKQFAFTLAETLIVMGIIGVVAALTLPNLNSSTGEKEKVAKVKKIYQNLNDAFGRAEAVYGPFDEWCAGYSGSCRSRHFERMLEFMKVSKKCDSVTSCTITIDQNGSCGFGATYSRGAILADGSTIVFSGDSTDYTSGWFRFDIDGTQKGANKQGYDVFSFDVDHENGVHVVTPTSDSSYVTYDSREKFFYDKSATAWIINFGNMDYLKTSDGTSCPNSSIKLTFGGNHSCK